MRLSLTFDSEKAVFEDDFEIDASSSFGMIGAAHVGDIVSASVMDVHVATRALHSGMDTYCIHTESIQHSSIQSYP